MGIVSLASCFHDSEVPKYESIMISLFGPSFQPAIKVGLDWTLSGQELKTCVTKNGGRSESKWKYCSECSVLFRLFCSDCSDCNVR